MSEEQFKAFLEKVKGDPRLQEELKAAKSSDEVISIAKEQGHDFSADHISQFSELNDDELDGIAGGKAIGYGNTNRPKSIFDDGKC